MGDVELLRPRAAAGIGEEDIKKGDGAVYEAIYNGEIVQSYQIIGPHNFAGCILIVLIDKKEHYYWILQGPVLKDTAPVGGPYPSEGICNACATSALTSPSWILCVVCRPFTPCSPDTMR